jgi:hypothetical protein
MKTHLRAFIPASAIGGVPGRPLRPGTLPSPRMYEERTRAAPTTFLGFFAEFLSAADEEWRAW